MNRNYFLSNKLRFYSQKILDFMNTFLIETEIDFEKKALVKRFSSFIAIEKFFSLRGKTN